MENKYKLTEESITFNGRKLYRIEAIRDFSNVKKGDKGGFVETERNLSHDGNAWVSDNAIVCGYARVSDHARVSGNAWVVYKASVFDKAKVSGQSMISGYANVSGDANVCGEEDYIVLKN